MFGRLRHRKIKYLSLQGVRQVRHYCLNTRSITNATFTLPSIKLYNARMMSNGKGIYKVLVKTGDRKRAGTDANVRIVLHGENDNATQPVKLDKRFRDDFERGKLDDFQIKDETYLEKIYKIELWRDNAGYSADWYVDTVEVQNCTTKESFYFPVYRWIKAHHHYEITHLDTSLPQFDPHRYQRKFELEDKRKVYELCPKVEGAPAQVKKIPDDEQFSFDYKWNIAKTKIQLIAASKIVKLQSGKWDSLAQLKNIYTKEIFNEPYGTKRWSNDLFFGLQRISSMNHSLIKLCTEIPEKLGVTDDMLKPFLEGWNLKQVIEAKRLFIVDLEILKDLPCKSDELILCSPIALFLVNGNNSLVPIAIQLFQEKADDNPVFLPTDPPYTWMMAKIWYNNADAHYHQALTHLGFTHLLMEGVTVVTHRNLSPSHPIFKLLAPHFLYLIAINTRGLELLVSPNGWVDKTMNSGILGMFELISRGIEMWRLDVHGTLPEDLKQRGVYSPSGKVLPGYHFRDDALLLYHAINNYVKKYVHLYYDTPEKISGDWELQKWALELTKERKANDGGCGLKGVPGNGKFENTDQIIQTVTCIIYTCSVGHAATNFPQYDEYAFPPNYPGLVRGVPPKNKSALTETDVLKCLPDKPTTLDIMVVTKILSGKGTNNLGDFEVQYVFDPPAKKIVEEFRQDIREISRKVKERNKERNPPYTWLDPDIVPNSISI